MSIQFYFYFDSDDIKGFVKRPNMSSIPISHGEPVPLNSRYEYALEVKIPPPEGKKITGMRIEENGEKVPDSYYKEDSKGEIVIDGSSLDYVIKDIHWWIYAEYSELPSLSTKVNGNGSVSAKPDKDYYDEGEEVTLTAEPAQFYTFDSWDGTDDDSSTELTNTVTMDSDKTITANFESGETHELTTVVREGNGEFVSPSTSPVSKFAGEVVDLSVNPDDEWIVKRWIGADNTPNEGENANTLTMPNEDTTVYVEFERAPYYLTLQPGENGSIVKPAEDGYFAVDKNVQLEADPDYGYKVESWSGTNDDSSTNKLNSVTMDSDKTVGVTFTEATYYNINTNVEGSGSITPDSGSYPEGHTVTLKALPSSGYTFKRWLNIDEDRDLQIDNASGTKLSVTMTEDKNITAIFEKIPQDIEVDFDVDSELSTIFYCPIDDYKSNIIEFNYTNDSDIAEKYHFKITFYSDIQMTNIVYSAFSLVDTKRWYADNGLFSTIDFDGFEIDSQEQVKIIYDPEILPQEKSSIQKDRTINDNNFRETPLQPGVKYYAAIEAYSENDTELELIEMQVIQIFIDDVNDYKWIDKKDKNNWICSANQKNDIQISNNDEQSLLPQVSTSLFGKMIIAWQGKMDIGYIIKGCIWDIEQDKFYSSGQGLYDKILLIDLMNPIALTDHAQNFYISGNNQNNIYINNCQLVESSDDSTEDKNIFDDTCYPGYDNLIDNKELFNIRVYEEDVDDSICLNKNKVLPVIEKEDINLEIAGIHGAYAVRFRESKDDSWGDWINIGVSLYNDEDKNKAYYIDSDRFIVPYKLFKYNGIRRICCEILTFYGRTRTICTELFANLDITQYSIELYSDSEYSNNVPIYEGYPVLSQNLEEEMIDSDYIDIYIKILFNQKQENGLKFNVIQEGLNNQYDLSLTTEDNKEFRGNFKLYESDGVFNKDGFGFIEVVYPSGEKLLNESDKFNLTMTEQNVQQYKNIKPSEALDTHIKDEPVKVLDINDFRQNYSKDDFNFGNSDIYKDN
ncbi:MAG: InlB B-repeat-containing protein [bacterium]